FDPKRNRSSLWEKYPHSEFVVPKFTFTKKKTNHYLTITLMVSEFDQAEKIVEKIVLEEVALFTPTSRVHEDARIVSQHEIEPTKWKESVQRAIDKIKTKQADKIVLARELRI